MKPRRSWLAILSISIAALFGQSLIAADWPQYRGSNQDGRSLESEILHEGEFGIALKVHSMSIGRAMISYSRKEVSTSAQSRESIKSF
jgi:hypothetical protein